MEDLALKLQEKNREDRHNAWILIVLGIPLAVVGIAVLSGGLLFLLLLLPPDGSGGTKSAVATVVVLVAVAIDVWRHPSEHFRRAQYYLVDGTVAVPQVEGVPPMVNVGDPRNWAEHGNRVVAGCSMAALGGARNIRKGAELLAVVRRRSCPEVLREAAEVLGWLADHGPLAEEELGTHLENRQAGFALADDLGRIGRRLQEGRKFVHAKLRDGASSP